MNNWSFDNDLLSPEVLQSITSLGYEKPTGIQEKVIPQVIGDKDVIVKSQTGSGKTAAFGIPIIEKIDLFHKGIKVLVLTPTRELAVQVCEELTDLGRYKKVRALPIYGKQNIDIQINQLRQRVHIVVGTPGRVADLIGKGYLKLDQIEYLVIDEADEMLKRGFIDEVRGIIDEIPNERNTLLFSATMPEDIENICSKYMYEPVWIEGEDETIPLDLISQRCFEIDQDWKLHRLKEIINLNIGTGIVFCNTQKMVDEVYDALKKARIRAGKLHGGMAQRDRLKAIKAFKNGMFTYLVATDLAGRGIHIEKLDLVVNYQVPIDPENYVHRIGRTGRVGESGIALTFVSEHDAKAFKEVESFIEMKVPKWNIDKYVKAYNSALKDEKSSKNTNKSANRKPINSKPINKKPVNKHKDIMKIRINKGKNRKIRAFDVVGATCNIDGITPDDIGIIDVRDTCTYVEIFNGKGDIAFNGLEKSTIKGKPITVKKIRL